MPLQLVSDEDLELLEGLQVAGSTSIVDALTRRAENRAWVEARMIHVILRAWGLDHPDNTAMLALYHVATKALRDAAARTFDMN